MPVTCMIHLAVSDSMYEDIWAGDKDILLTACLHQIKAPTHIIWGRYDRVSQENCTDVFSSLTLHSNIKVLVCDIITATTLCMPIHSTIPMYNCVCPYNDTG